MHPKKLKMRGFTLMELMIVVAVLGILAAVAFPSYQSYIRKGKRTDGKNALIAVQLAQEKWRVNHGSYASTVAGSDCGTAAATGLCLSANSPMSSEGGYYSVSITSGDSVGFVVTAAAQGDQANDKQGSTSCATLSLTVSSDNPTGKKESSEADYNCWK